MEQNVIQINGGIMINVTVSVENVMYVKKVIFGIQLYVVVKMENIKPVLGMIQRLSVIKLLKKKQKQLQQILMKKVQSVK